ncbi:MAG: DUF2183 domain-containing protein [Microscillaceae bacterium]|jgi:phosphatidate phosphatase APP1|nr:DUF2183 domain-containing protein [Microscillaceae bacterium]
MLSNWKNILKKISSNAEEKFDKLKNDFKNRLGWQRDLLLIPYRGFSNGKHIYMRGRVLEDRRISTAEDNDSLWENLLNSYKRLNSNEIAQAQIRVSIGDWYIDLLTDKEGYFLLNTELPNIQVFDNEILWQSIHVELRAIPQREIEPLRVEGLLQLPTSTTEFGVISDVDDTILQTGATNLLKMARLTFLHNAKTRLPFAGVAAFYQALQAGKTENARNPIFYVSSSPWNLYDLLTDFCDFQQIPQGTFFLRDYGLDADKEALTDHHDHKLTQIAKIMQMYPTMQFVLIGDNGQHDPEIYLEAIKTYPGRITAVYIRDVAEAGRDAEVTKICQAAQGLGVPMQLVADTLAAAHHAAQIGLINPNHLDKIKTAQTFDLTETDGLL